MYLIDYRFKLNSNYTFKKVEDLEVEFKVKDKNNNRYPLTIIDTVTRKETLGVYLALDRNMNY